jgi:hypothetical protein
MSYPAATTGLGVAAKVSVQGTQTPLSSVPGKNKITISLSGANGPENFQLDPILEDAGGNIITPGTAYVVASVASAAAQFTETLSAAATASGGTTVYTTSSAPAAGSLVGQSFVVAGFVTNASNNGTFLCTANTTTTITLNNAAGIAETHAATATSTPNVAVYTGTFTGATTGSLVGKTVDIAGFVTNTVNNGSFLIVANTSTTSITVDNTAAVAETHAATATVEEGASALTYFADGTRSYVGGTSPVPVGATGVKVVNVSASGLVTSNGVIGRSVVEVSYPTFNNTIGSLTVGGVSLPINKVYADVEIRVIE